MTEVSRGGSFDTLSDFVSIAKGVVATGQNLDEANTKAKIVTPFIRTLGWHVYDNSEVLLEYSGEEEFDDRVDYALFGPDGLYAVIEAKQIGREIADDDPQIRRYMRLFGAKWGLLTNGDRYFIYRTNGESDETRVESVSLVDLPSNPHVQNLTRQSAYTESATPDPADENLPQITPESREKIEEFVNRKRSDNQHSRQESTFGPLYDSLVESIAPSVYGHESEKLGVLLSLVGGVRKSVENGRYARGAINILIVHDPGTLTPDVAESAARLAPQTVYLSGTTSSEEHLATHTDSRISSPSKLSKSSIRTLSRASHAVITRFGEFNETDLKHMQEAFSAELPSNDSDFRTGMQKTTALIATSQPRYGQFDQYEPIGEQIDLEPALISRFDLIFTVTDQPDPDEDRKLAQHILWTNYAGELYTHQEKSATSNVSREQVENVTDEIEPEIDADLLRKYVAYAQQTCYPRMTEEAKEAIQEFYVDLRSKGADEDAPVPVTARKLEALVRLSEASARVRLSDTVDQEDAQRVIEIVRSCLQDIGVDPETGEYDVDAIETGRSKAQRDRRKGIKEIIRELQEEYHEKPGAPEEKVLQRASESGIDREKAEHEIQELRNKGEIYSPDPDHIRCT